MDYVHHLIILRSSILSDSIPGPLDTWAWQGMQISNDPADHFGFVNCKAISFSALPVKQKESNKT